MSEQKPSRIRKALRVFIKGLLIAAVLLAITYAIFEVLGARREKAVRARWAQSVGSLEEFQRSLPATKQNDEAKTLEALAANLGLRQEQAKDPWKSVSAPLTDYLNAELAKPSPGLTPPPEAVAAYLSSNSETIASIRRQLLEGAAPVWESRANGFYEAPIPNLLSLLGIQKTLAAEALTAMQRGADAAAAEDLEASWRLHQALAGRPEMISAIVDQALLRIQAGVLRKRAYASPVWRERLGAIDPRSQLLRGYKVEACAMLEAGDSANWTRIVTSNPGVHYGILTRLSHGYVRLCAADSAGTFLDMVQLLRASDPCAADSKQRVDEIVDGIPRWNFFSRIALPNLTSSWQRADRMKLDLELTGKVLQAREARDLNGGRWPEAVPGIEISSCKGERWSYTCTPAQVTLAFSGNPEIDPGRSLVLPMRYEENLEPVKGKPAGR